MTVNLSEWGKQLEILNVAVYEHASAWSWRRGELHHFNLWLALEGEGIFTHAGRSWPFSSGSLFLFPAGMATEGCATRGQRMTNFTAHLKARGKAAAMLNRLAREGSPVRLRNFIWASHFCRYLSEAFYFNPDSGREVVLSGLQLLLQSMEYERALRPTNPTDREITRIVERIRRNPAAAYSVPELAGMARLSAAQFTRRFKILTGFTPNRFLVEERLARAESYLRETTMSVQEIADRLGYQDIYFFSRQFRRFRGAPPSGLRSRDA